MKHLKTYKLYENEFTKLASHLMMGSGGIHSKMNFTTPNDNFTISQCKVTFPDMTILRFATQENIQDDTKLFTLSTLQDDGYSPVQKSISDLYLKLYGSKIQLDNHDSYKMIRLYMNREDLYGTQFDAYIYDENKLGFIEVTVEIEKQDVKGILVRNPLVNDLHRLNTILNLTIKSLKDNYISLFKSNRSSITHHFLELLEDETDEFKVLDPALIYCDIDGNRVNLLVFFYLYTALVSHVDEIKDILRSHKLLRKEILVDALIRIHT